MKWDMHLVHIVVMVEEVMRGLQVKAFLHLGVGTQQQVHSTHQKRQHIKKHF